MESIDELSCIDKSRHTSLDGGDSNGVGLAQVITRRGHEPRDRSSRRYLL
jgi:hypothetical protein